MITAMLLYAALGTGADGKFVDVVMEKPYDAYLLSNPLLMEVAGAKVLRLSDGRRVVLAVASVALKDDKPRTRLEAERVCVARATASVAAEQQGVQVAHIESVEDRSVVVIENGKEKGKNLFQVLQVTKSQVQGLVRGLTVVGRWKSRNGAVFYLALGMTCDARGEPIAPPATK